MNYPRKVNVNRLRSCHCLCRHFELDGYYLHQRYPEVLVSDTFTIFTFIRDPLHVQSSLFRFEKKFAMTRAERVEDQLFSRPNYLAYRFPVTEKNYREVIDKYVFEGILEEAQASLDLLARILGKPRRELPWSNKTQQSNETHVAGWSEECIARFRRENALDYLVYDYCVESLRRMREELGEPDA